MSFGENLDKFPYFGIEIPNWAAALMIIPMIIPVYELI